MSRKIDIKIKKIAEVIKILNGLGIWDFKDEKLINVVSKLNETLADITEIIKLKKSKRVQVNEEEHERR